MKNLILIFLILGCGFANRIWGSAWFKGNKETAVFLFGLVISFALYFYGLSWQKSGMAGLATEVLFFFGRIWSHGVYFCCFNPVLLTPASMAIEGEQWINRICNLLVPDIFKKSNNAKRLWGFIGMSLRGIYYIPLIASFCYLNLCSLYLSIGTIFIGCIYTAQYWQPQNWWNKQMQVPVAEFLTGALLGFLIFMGISQ